MRNLWIIGGTSGIGEAYAQKAARQQQWGDILVTGAEHDVRNVDLMAKCLDEMRFTDIVYCAGVNQLRWMEYIGLDHFRTIMEVNVFGFLHVCTLAELTYKGPMNIVAVSSDASVRPMRTSHVYCASKAALNMAIKTMAREKAPDGWRVNGVAPGIIDRTKMTEYIDRTVPDIREWSYEQHREYESSQVPMGRRGEVDEVADVIDAVLNGPAYLNGEIVFVNGGR